jgi:hypothetical protein
MVFLCFDGWETVMSVVGVVFSHIQCLCVGLIN